MTAQTRATVTAPRAQLGCAAIPVLAFLVFACVFAARAAWSLADRFFPL